MTLDEHGAELLPGAAVPFLDALEAALASQPRDRAGVRLHAVPGLAALLAPDALGRHAARQLGPGTRPVRAILFDKSDASNWALGWHQDRTIAVAARAEVPGYGPWSIKAGLQHVEPPFAVIEQMRTIRIHLDPVDADNAPLLVAPGSHCLGRLPDGEIDAAVARCGTAVCQAQRGDVWIYATPSSTPLRLRRGRDGGGWFRSIMPRACCRLRWSGWAYSPGTIAFRATGHAARCG